MAFEKLHTDSSNYNILQKGALISINTMNNQTMLLTAGEYTFEDVLPGQYEVIVDTDIFCWDSPNRQIVIASEKPPNVPAFRQTGFSVTFISSHNTRVQYSLPNEPSKRLSFELSKGSTRHCIPVPGRYDFHPDGCHVYEQTAFSWNTNERTPIILSSTEHLHTGSILSPVPVEGVSVKMEGDADGQVPLT